MSMNIHYAVLILVLMEVSLKFLWHWEDVFVGFFRPFWNTGVLILVLMGMSKCLDPCSNGSISNDIELVSECGTKKRVLILVGSTYQIWQLYLLFQYFYGFNPCSSGGVFQIHESEQLMCLRLNRFNPCSNGYCF